MKVITWNCNMAFRKKIRVISDLNPDIMVISECEEFSKFKDEDINEYPNRYWVGTNKSKGIGILAKKEYDLQINEKYSDNFKYVVPIMVKGKYDFILFAIWAMNDRENVRNRYISQVGAALKYYEDLLLEDCIITGDFNSNVIWDNDSPKKIFTHRDVIYLLHSYNIKSLFHTLNDEIYGEETVPTLYMYRHQDKGYHIDYSYCSQRLINNLLNYNIGTYGDWINYSDHMPLIFEFR
jgi:exonuclease III